MAFIKTARAKIVHSDVSKSYWGNICSNSNLTDFSKRKSSKIVLDSFEPRDVMLSHCSIVSSVDTEKAKQPLGKHLVGGFEINRPWDDWRVTKETEKFINNNSDCWERKLLLSSFRTFIGGANYVEHVQIPELNKGRIIDAAARDIGPSIYIDILVATERKHKDLINLITSGQLQTLSMGCSVQVTICTQCGNAAYDETQLCPHIKYNKGSKFKDERGLEHTVAELCGHIEEEPGSVTFYEASWVGVPAFEGAVVRSIFNTTTDVFTPEQKETFFSQVKQSSVPAQFMTKAAKQILAQDGEFPGASEIPPQNPASTEDPMDKAVSDVADYIRERALEKVRSQLDKEDVAAVLPSENRNDTIIKEAFRKDARWKHVAKYLMKKCGSSSKAKTLLVGMVLHKTGGVQALKRRGFQPSMILQIDYLCRRLGNQVRAGDARLYQVMLDTGGIKNGDVMRYLKACSQKIGRNLTSYERKILIEKGEILLSNCKIGVNICALEQLGHRGA